MPDSTRQIVAGIILYKTDFALLRRCIRSLLSQDMPQDALLTFAFLDNHQGYDTDRLAELIEEFGIEGRTVYRESSENVGFGAGHNRIFNDLSQRGVALDYYLCINPDSILHRNCIAALIAFAGEQMDRGLFEGRQFPVEHPKPYNETTFETDWCSGCLLLIPGDIYRQLGGFDSAFFMYCEDVDLSWRARLEGLACYTVPNALVHHYVHRSARNSQFEYQQMLRSGYLLATKFQNRAFAEGLMPQVREALSPDELTALVSRPISYIPRQKLAQASLDFEHGFHFAVPRW